MPLTQLQVKNAKATGKPLKLSDGGGLFLLVQSPDPKASIEQTSLTRSISIQTLLIGKISCLFMKGNETTCYLVWHEG